MVRVAKQHGYETWSRQSIFKHFLPKKLNFWKKRYCCKHLKPRGICKLNTRRDRKMVLHDHLWGIWKMISCYYMYWQGFEPRPHAQLESMLPLSHSPRCWSVVLLGIVTQLGRQKSWEKDRKLYPIFSKWEHFSKWQYLCPNWWIISQFWQKIFSFWENWGFFFVFFTKLSHDFCQTVNA